DKIRVDTYLAALIKRVNQVKYCDEYIDIDSQFVFNVATFDAISDYYNYEDDEYFLPKQLLCKFENSENTYLAIMYSESSHLTDFVSIVSIEGIHVEELFTVGYFYLSENATSSDLGYIKGDTAYKTRIYQEWYYNSHNIRTLNLSDTVHTSFEIVKKF
ncbi:hypothetical protein CEQ90_20625, partial [Lewinellaceae bacterium SD302]